jgi:uncharacterized membrane protein
MFSSLMTFAYFSGYLSIGVIIFFYGSVVYSAIFKRKDYVKSEQIYSYVRASRWTSIIILITALLTSFTEDAVAVDKAIKKISKYLFDFGIWWAVVFLISVILSIVLKFLQKDRLAPTSGAKNYSLGDKCHISLVQAIIYLIITIFIMR